VRVKEPAFKSINLKGEAARRLTMVGMAPTTGGAGIQTRLGIVTNELSCNTHGEEELLWATRGRGQVLWSYGRAAGDDR
jgi:hypothetical protein